MTLETLPEDHQDAANQSVVLSRRRLLKLLAAASGAAVVSTVLPDKWSKPMMEVGVLPAHAQTSTVPTAEPTEEPTPAPVYTIVCNSDPGAGDLWVSEGSIRDITARLALTSGTGPVEGLTITMTAEAAEGFSWVPTFTPPMPQTAVTDATGLATFNDIITPATEATPEQDFWLVFTCTTPSGVVSATLGKFYFSII